MESSFSPELCCVCFERPGGAKLQPCGHDYFCQPCAWKFRTCPLCREPVLLANNAPCFASSDAPSQSDSDSVIEHRRDVFTHCEVRLVVALCFVVWLFIFIGGFMEFSHGIPLGCEPGDPELTPIEAAARGQEVVHPSVACIDPDFVEESRYCTTDGYGNKKGCSVATPQFLLKKCGNTKACYKCREGFINYGNKCFKYLENIPAVRVGAALGGSTYFVLIVLTQIGGIVTELFLIRRLKRFDMLPRRELVVLTLALLFEIARMFMIDVFMLMDYFGERSYSVFRAPSSSRPCQAGVGWVGADGLYYCDGADRADALYFIGSHKEAFSSDTSVCSTFSRTSALLDFEASAPRFPDKGAPRFAHFGWIIGGEFALFYFFATFINELADILFVVPITSSSGWRYKIISLTLEIFQLGALCPAAMFTYGECIHFTNPLGFSLHAISFIVTTFGYCCWGFAFLIGPLSIVGFLACGGFVLLWHMFFCIASSLLPYFRCVRHFLDSLESCGRRSISQFISFHKWFLHDYGRFLGVSIMFACVPLLLGGIFLGSLVFVGQASKQGTMSVLTAVVLLSDVLFKVTATLFLEAMDLVLHLRVSRAVQRRQSVQVGSTEEEDASMIGRQW